MSEVKVLDQREVFGRSFCIYGTTEEPLFLARDVAYWIGHTDITRLTNLVDEDEKLKRTMSDSGQRREMWFLTEDGLYEVLMQSRKPVAKKFKKKIKEILKSIRSHGAYMTDETIEKVLSDPDTIIELATRLKDEKAKRLEAEKLTRQISISENSLLVREVAKIVSKEGIKIGEKRLYEKLRSWGLIMKNSTEPMQEGIDRGYFEIVEGAKDSYKGTFVYRTTRVTGKGQIYIIKRLLRESEAV
jgi:prophage antirepressor-like protein